MVKKLIVGVLICSAVGSVNADDYRSFTDVEGRTMDAKIISFNPNKQLVRIERKDGKRVWIAPDLFSEDDQDYIRDWIAADLVLNEKNLQVIFKKGNAENLGSKKELKEWENAYYNLTLNNRSATPIEGIRIEYKYFIDIYYPGAQGTKHVERKVEGRQKTVHRIDAKGQAALSTDPVPVETKYWKVQELTSSGNVEGKTIALLSEEELEGIWLRIYGPEVDGTRPYRDVSFPETLKDHKKW